jgi:cytochrome c oxidase assembly protein subunit 15
MFFKKKKKRLNLALFSLNRHMTKEEFKNIFYWEWSHRMIGRFIGMSFILPGLYFGSKGYMSKRVMKQTFGITCLLGFQVIFFF